MQTLVKPIVVTCFGAVIMFSAFYAGLMALACVGCAIALLGLLWMFGMALVGQ